MARIWLVLVFAAFLAGCGGWGISYKNGKDLRTPIEKAAQQGDLIEVKRLLASGVDPNGRGGVFGSPLNAAAMRNGNVETIRALLAAGANPNGRGQDGKNCWPPPLFAAVSIGDVENTGALLDAGASVQPTSCSKLVVGWLRPAVIELLVQRGLDLNAVDENGRNQLHLALESPVVPPVDGIEYLIHAGVPLNARDRFGKTPLAYWREPRDYERASFTTWLFERLAGDSVRRQERENHAKISALLERSGAVL